ncbi:MAG: effector-associated constant component EACC1 [Pseudonocardiaceae bacterium]
METQIRLAVRLDQAGDAELTELIDLLRDAGAEAVTRPRLGTPVPGTRGVDAAIADVVANVAPVVGLLERIVTALRGWLARRPRRTLKMTIGDATIELTGFSTASEDQLVKAFLQHVCERG